MRWTIRLLFLVFCTPFCLAQEGNPFDIGPAKGAERLIISQSTQQDSNSIHDEEAVAQPKEYNPFDINKESRSLVSKREEPSNTEILSPTATVDTKQPSEIITLIYIIVVLCLLTFAISINRSRFVAILKSLFNSNFLKNLYKENRAWTDLQSIVLYSLFVSNAAYLIYLLNYHYFNGELPGLLILLLSVLAVYAIRHFTMVFISYVYGMDTSVDLHNFSIGIHNMVLGIVLIPFIMGYGFVSPQIASIVLFLLCSFVLIFYALRQIKGGLSIITSRDFNVFYFFIYLCAVEIAPILITWKVVSGAL